MNIGGGVSRAFLDSRRRKLIRVKEKARENLRKGKVLSRYKRNRLKLRKYFFQFGKGKDRIAKLYLKRSYTNIFLTLTDWADKIIISKTSGNSGLKGSKRRKKVPLALETIVKSLIDFFKFYHIKKIIIIIKMRINFFFHYLVSELSHYNIKVKGFKTRRSLPFNGVKGRNLRRV